MDNIFNYKNYISTVGVYEQLFQKYQNVWETLNGVDEFINEFKNNLPEGYKEISENVFVGQDVIIKDFSKIDGKAIIGSGSTIGHSAYLRGGVLIGENVNVGHAVEVKHSIILSNSAVAHLNYIGDSVIGNNVNVGGGAKLANWRFDKKNISIRKDGEDWDTGMDKFGSVISDGCGIGVNAVLNPGTILGKNSFVYPLVAALGFYPQDSKIKE